MEPNSQLDALLDQSGVSRAGLATRINRLGDHAGITLRYDHTAVARWLRGQRPRGRVPELICEVLGEKLDRTLTLGDIGMGVTATGRTPACLPGAEGDGLNRFVERAASLWRSDQVHDEWPGPSLLTGAAAVAPVWEWENPPEDRDVSHRGATPVTESDVTVLHAARGHYEHLYRNAGGVATRARVVGFLNAEVAPLLRGGYDDKTGRELCRAAGSLAAISGICAYDADAQGLAQRYFHQALRLGKASGDLLFGGYVVSLLVNQALFLGDSRHALACAEAVLRVAGPRTSPALATDLYAMQAKAYARLGDRSAAHTCMRRAEAYSQRIRPEEEPEETGYVQPGLVEVRLAEALLLLGELRAAARYAQEAARAPAHVRGRVNRLATLTDVALHAGEPERAAVTAAEMVGTAQGIESQRLRGRMRRVRQRLAQHPGTSAAEAAKLIEEALSVPF
ncbi:MULTISPECIES: transcriptional regulator [unclassified Streptomyces]|uniref:transcriptional regulator n=1 Tax=unclassified Streptomyces TaxID=2593676 RepID=UPI002DD823E5|nr:MULTISPECIES: transcriptional regulator [unclassified Streptomyces]WSA92438.1 transcriptional regulator [Streptomyces sp. NBC_01795]WSB76804.1 transcriptional regulator [Streptomyces sp. NBC_01775]WSS14919.1 transcriptional regulator [Streptomyces sp. NBC_01186]WSS43762.1 transcriptional regulator [Streptomyces sp. NBC_01187]